MGSLSEEEHRFFDAYEDIASISDAKSDSFEIFDSHSSFDNTVSISLHHELWIKSLGSVQEQRSKFFDWMGIGLNENGNRNLEAFSPEGESDRITESSGAVLRKSCFEDEFCSTRSMMSCWSNGESSMSAELGLVGNFVCREGDSGGGMVCKVDELGQDVKANEGCEVDSEQSVAAEESEKISESSPSFQKPMQNEVGEPNTLVDTPRRLKKGWLSRIRSISCIVYSLREADKLRHDDDDDDDALLRYRVQRVKVHRYGKRIKELSALYKGQDIQAHEGSILTMKFSPDGQYLASAGEDGVVRVWQVLESERSNELDIPEIDPSCIYFTVNQLSELKPLLVEKERTAKMRSMRKTSDSACVIFPPKVFRILEKPLHEFHGHREEILDLSWSKNNHLLSASVDKTVCLWQVGRDSCLRVFLHSNYVTCVQFNPVDDNHFMSGSIDGKVRIWAVNSCQVVDWTDIKDIVTAVCYRPDGQGGIVGSLTGNCRFYNMSGSDSYLQLDAQICLPGKKKSPCKRITGFQFSPQDSTKVMVSCADSQVRILQGLDVIGKYKSNTANQISASFTLDGKHIISACEDSNVHLWNYIDQEQHATPQSKNSRSYEHFSANASVAIPWCGLKCGSLDNGWGFRVSDNNSQEVLPLSSPAHFSLSQEYFSESFPKGCATWPEEKLSSSPLSTSSAMHKSQYKFLKTSCQSTDSSHAWGLVIVTAGWDGRIKSFHNYGLPVSD